MRGTASKLDIDARTVWKWRSRFVDHRLAGLHDELRPGKPRGIDDGRVAKLINTTLHARPSNSSTHWSVRSMDIHCIVDNDASHSHPKVEAWLANRPRWRLHFIPTCSSWLNEAERFFGLITDKTIRRGSFTSVKQLVQRIDQLAASHNENCQAFQWTATAESILSKINRLCGRISGTAHYLAGLE